MTIVVSKICAARLWANWCLAASRVRAKRKKKTDAGREDGRRRPRPDLPAGRIVLGERDQDDDEREGDQPDERDPALDAPQLHVAPSRSSAQRAWSARSVVLALGVPPERRAAPPGSLAARVSERDDRVPPQPARIVPRDVQPRDQVGLDRSLGGKPGEQVDVGGLVGRQAGAAPLDAPVPRTDVLADVAAVHLRAERRAVGLRDRLGHLRPVGEAAGRVEHARLVERTRRAGLDAAGAGAAALGHRHGQLELQFGHERPEHDPRAVAARDQHRVLAVEADPGAGRSLAVDVLVRVDQHPVGAAELPPERVKLLAQRGVGVVPRVARQAAVAVRPLRLGQVVAERGRDDAPRPRQRPLGMAGKLGPRGREAEPPEEPARLALADVALGALVGLGPRDADCVEAELCSEAPYLGCPHRLHCYSGSRESLSPPHTIGR